MHVKNVGEYYGELQSNRFHLECLTAMHQDLKESEEEEFEPHAHKRWSLDEASSQPSTAGKDK